MTHAAIAVQAAIHSILSTDSDVLALLGGPFSFDHVPRRQRPPYIVYGKSAHRDWSTDTEAGTAHEIRLDIWSRQNGRKQVLDIAEAAVAALDTLPNAVDGHAIVNFGHEFTEVFRDEETDYFSAAVNLRIVTEPNQTH